MNVLIADDSYLIRSILKALIGGFPGFRIAGEAGNGQKALELVQELKPDLVLMDVNMPVMDGIEATGKIMETCPVPVIILTSEDIAEVGYKALNRGALEVVPKPGIDRMNSPAFAEQFQTILESAVRYRETRSRRPQTGTAVGEEERVLSGGGRKPRSLVVIGASTGGPSALRTLLADLPADFPAGILVCQHIEEGFDSGYALWLNGATPLQVRLAGEREIPRPGTVLVAPATHHLVCTDGMVFREDSPRINNQKPSVDRMFKSAAAAYGPGVLGVLLTGMGRDGAEGCLEILKGGGITLVQDRESSLIYGMPKAAVELNAASRILPLSAMAAALRELCAP